MQASSQGPSFLKINPEPSRNPFCQARDFGGLHVEVPNKHTRLSTPNHTKLTQGSIKQLIGQSKLLSISVSSLIAVQNNQVHEPASTQWQHAPNRPTTVKKPLKLSSGKGGQSNRCTPHADDTNPSITNMGGTQTSRSPDGCQPLLSKPSPLTPDPSWDQPVLNNSKKVNTSLQG